MKKHEGLSKAEIEDIIELSKSPGFVALKKYVILQQKSLANQSLICKGDVHTTRITPHGQMMTVVTLDNQLGDLNGRRFGMGMLMEYIKTGAKAELDERIAKEKAQNEKKEEKKS